MIRTYGCIARLFWKIKPRNATSIYGPLANGPVVHFALYLYFGPVGNTLFLLLPGLIIKIILPFQLEIASQV
jgi:hypothetical protein